MTQQGREPSAIPKRLKFALKNFEVGNGRVLDLGCGHGEYLRHFGPGSLGLDISQNYLEQARSKGLNVRSWNFAEGFPADLNECFDAVWCSNLLEHVIHPHQFLISIAPLLAPNGRVLIVVPNTTILRVGPWRGYLAHDHVNFFTPRTLRWTLSYAGYQVDFVGTGSLASAPKFVSRLLAPIGPTIIGVATPIKNFQYPSGAHKELRGGQIVFKEFGKSLSD